MKKEYIVGIVGGLVLVGGVGAYAYSAGKDMAYRSAMRGGMGQGEKALMGGGYRQYEGGMFGGEFMHRSPITTDTSALSEAETAGLIKMHEEEKLARDVYTALGEKWGAQVFTNIAQSEDQHADAVKSLLTAHGVTDPVTDDVRGVFANQDLAKLYTDLVARGQSSIVEAYRVGAYIEDLDIADLEKEIDATTHEDMKFVYERLQKGSENHLRAFNRNIEIATGEPYDPEFMSDDTFESIVERENGFGQGGVRGDKGNGMRDGSERGMGRW
ncbi:MAG: DUF2202 domain-containing protein [Candidatus Kaiserbacteria bacterium]|nr:DUF2202 domain-containing protein [Candidatus Kaiserbacteria bacterium]